MQKIIFIALIVLLFFDDRKIPVLMKDLGKRIPASKKGSKAWRTASI